MIDISVCSHAKKQVKEVGKKKMLMLQRSGQKEGIGPLVEGLALHGSKYKQVINYKHSTLTSKRIH